MKPKQKQAKKLNREGIKHPIFPDKTEKRTLKQIPNKLILQRLRQSFKRI